MAKQININRDRGFELLGLITKVTLSLIVAYILSNLDFYHFKDLHNYIFYFNNIEARKELLLNSSIVFFEPLFFIFGYITTYFFDADFIVRIIIFMNVYTLIFKGLSLFNYSIISVFFIALCFFQPQVFALELVTIRQGIGLTACLWILPKLGSTVKIAIFMAILGMIHNSFFIISLFFWILYFLNKFSIKSFGKKTIYLFVLSLVFNLLLMVLLQFVEIKQEGYSEGFESQAGGGGMVVFTIILLYIYFFKGYLINDPRYSMIFEFCVVGLIIYITSYFLTPIAGRIIGTFIPFIYLLILTKPRIIDLYFCFAILLLNLYLFFNGGAEGFMVSELSALFDNINQIIFY